MQFAIPWQQQYSDTRHSHYGAYQALLGHFRCSLGSGQESDTRRLQNERHQGGGAAGLMHRFSMRLYVL